MFDGKAFGEEIVGMMQDYVERKTAPLKAENDGLKERLAAIEARGPEKGEPGQDGEDGVSPEPEAIVDAFRPQAEEIIAGAVARAVAEIPIPEKGEKGEPGEPGQDGRDAEVEEWASQLSTEERAVLVAAMLRKEIGTDELFDLPDLPPLAQSSPHPAMVVHNHLPSRGREKTVVTKHDDRGRIIEFERFEQ